MAQTPNHRPPAIAQQRFAARRAEFEGLDLAQRFERIHEANLWGADNSVSGVGSELEATAAIRERLPGLLKELGVRSILDAPCGDHRWMASLDLDLERYVGVDIVPSIIETLQRRHQGDARRSFLLADMTCEPLPRCDLILSRDCLVHFSFATLQRALRNLKASSAVWLLTTTFPQLERNEDIEDADWRPLNFAIAPLNWPAPVEIINERCTEADGAYADKSLALWRLSDLPDA
ncbi:class I SAM-dependent methyltransferase [Dongia deserti]|uniref:class I SAM-dependent methyltransferase n=1 Tax=Dongia deserti TaxID=2268030 RepID=UPI000E647422|nr:class I SAM-dependent methyltransferase [Dongia deserti]